MKLHRIRTPYSPDTDCVLPYKAIRSPYRGNTGSVFGGVSRCVKEQYKQKHKQDIIMLWLHTGQYTQGWKFLQHLLQNHYCVRRDILQSHWSGLFGWNKFHSVYISSLLLIRAEQYLYWYKLSPPHLWPSLQFISLPWNCHTNTDKNKPYTSSSCLSYSVSVTFEQAFTATLWEYMYSAKNP